MGAVNGLPNRLVYDLQFAQDGVLFVVATEWLINKHCNGSKMA